MRASNNGAQSPPSNTRTTTPSTTNAIINTHQHHNNNNNNNNNSSSSGSRSAAGSNTENSGSQYAMCALGVGLVALGIVMIVWSVVPADGGGDGGDGGRLDNRNKVSSVAFVLVGSGVVMLLLSLCLGVRNKQREQRGLRDAEAGRQAGRQAGAAGGPREDAETAEEHARRFAVPSYEEVVGSGQYPIRQSNHRQSTTQLPSYEDLVDRADGLQFENEVTDGVGVAGGDPASTTAAAAATPTEGVAPNRRAGKAARKLLNNKIRRIKSEKLHLKDVDGGQPPARFSIEPLTPPPQYEDKVPPI